MISPLASETSREAFVHFIPKRLTDSSVMWDTCDPLLLLTRPRTCCDSPSSSSVQTISLGGSATDDGLCLIVLDCVAFAETDETSVLSGCVAGRSRSVSSGS
uniref:(northern house mosquito) hypothetical protein n=1 Tax=Culex pipiens TaxID=7175 RepID=A0A8D8APS4_CULPI